MDVKDFVKTTLLQIAEAIDETNDEFGGVRRFQLSYAGAKTQKQAKEYSMVEFDLAVEVKVTGSRKKGGGVKVAVLEAKASSEKEDVSSVASRIKFVVMDNH